MSIRALTAIALAALVSVGCANNHAFVASPIPDAVVAHKNDATSYPAPSNFSVDVNATGVAWLRWRRPAGSSIFTRAYVYRGTENDFDAATLLTTFGSISSIYIDSNLSSGVKYYYWVRYGDGTTFGDTASTSAQYGNTQQEQSSQTPVAAISYEVDPATLNAAQAPLLISNDRIQIGAFALPENVGPRNAEHDNVDVWDFDAQDGVDSDTLQSYLSDDARAFGKTTIARFHDAPIIRLQRGATREQIKETAHAVQVVNQWLPNEWKLSLDVRPVEHDPGRPDDGVIIVEFANRFEWALPGGSNTLGKARKWLVGSKILSAEVWIDPNESFGAERMNVLVHELLHALGRDHVTNAAYPNTLMHATPRGVNGHVLHALDRDALMAVYGVLDADTQLHELSDDLGEWADTSSNLTAKLQGSDVRFGVMTRNGFSRAFVAGQRPLYDLSDNMNLNGSASWNGRLVAFTPDVERVAGDMNMSVDLVTMIGAIGFSSLEMWDDVIGAVGSGEQWKDGHLNYAIRVTGNNFTRIGGDAGVITGSLFGSEHDAAGGVLYRDDLTGAFAGTRSADSN